MSPTELTLKLLRKQGKIPWIVEKWNPFAHIRQDAYGFIDILAIGTGAIEAWQSTDDSHLAEHVTKCLSLKLITKKGKIVNGPRANVEAWLRSGGKLFLIGWSEKGPRGEKKVMTPRVIELRMDPDDQKVIVEIPLGDLTTSPAFA